MADLSWCHTMKQKITATLLFAFFATFCLEMSKGQAGDVPDATDIGVAREVEIKIGEGYVTEVE